MYELSTASAHASPAMDALFAWGIAVIHAFQLVASPALTVFARAVTFLGEPWVYLAILPFVFWCVNEKRGARLGLSVLLASGIVGSLKVNLAIPRPGTIDPSVELITPPDPWSTPSGHAAGSAVLWPVLALGGRKNDDSDRAGKRAGNLACRLSVALGIPLLVGLSRVYLGVHYPTDVLFGWAIGAVFSIFVIALLPALGNLAQAGSDDPESRVNLIARIHRSIDAHRASSGGSFRSFKLALAAIAAFALNAATPGDSSMGGAVFGFALGYIFLTEKKAAASTAGDSNGARFSARSGSALQKAIRCALGLAVLAVLYVGLKKAFPGDSSPYYSLLRFIRYGLLGFWVTFGAPITFVRLGLARQE